MREAKDQISLFVFYSKVSKFSSFLCCERAAKSWQLKSESERLPTVVCRSLLYGELLVRPLHIPSYYRSSSFRSSYPFSSLQTFCKFVAKKCLPKCTALDLYLNPFYISRVRLPFRWGLNIGHLFSSEVQGPELISIELTRIRFEM